LLRVAQVRSPVKLDTAELHGVLRALAEGGWTPAVLESEQRFAELAGISAPASSRVRVLQPRAGDVVFRGEDLFFLVEVNDEELRRQRYFTSGSPTVYEAMTMVGSGLHVGLVSADPEADTQTVENRLAEFTGAIEVAAMSSLDGRKARHLKFEWAPVGGGEDRLEVLCARLTEEGGGRFSSPEADDAAVQGAATLADPAARELLRELSEVGFARESDMLARRGSREEEFRASLGALKAAGLVTTEFMLQCRKSSTPLTRLASRDQLADPTVGSLKCAACNRRFAEELLSEGHLVADLGRSLLRGSHWMTVWVTQRFLELGVPAEAIVWNLEESGEEVDILVGFLGRLWILELKDREFGPGDAHPFSYRRARYRADEAIVISTDKVSPEAKRIFGELASQGRGRLQRQRPDGRGEPTYIEGLDQVGPVLQQAIDNASVAEALDALRIPSLATGFDLGALMKEKTSASPRRRARSGNPTSARAPAASAATSV
jgi:DNA-binding transcriptional ArsR family regulator